MWVCSHAPLAFRSEFSKFGSQLSGFVEQFFGLVGSQPFFQHPQVFRVLCRFREWNLMRTERSFDLLAIDELWSSPTFRRAQNDHGPRWTLRSNVLARVCLNRVDLIQHRIESCGHELMHWFGVVTFNEIRFMPVAGK